jgi:hypothetical protein
MDTPGSPESIPDDTRPNGSSSRREQQPGELADEIAALRRMVQHYGDLTEQLAATLRRDHGASRAERGALLGHLVVHFSPLYLTLLSIIHGVALTFFVERLNATAADLTVAVWLQAAVTLLTLIFVWHQWVVVTLFYVWLPTFADAVIPFLFGVAEVFLAETIGPDATRWFGARTLIWLMGLVSTVYTRRRARKYRRNTHVLEAYGSPTPSYVGMGLGLLVDATLWGLAQYHLLDPSSWVGPGLSLGVVLVFVVASTGQWRVILRHVAADEDL